MCLDSKHSDTQSEMLGLHLDQMQCSFRLSLLLCLNIALYFEKLISSLFPFQQYWSNRFLNHLQKCKGVRVRACALLATHLPALCMTEVGERKIETVPNSLCDVEEMCITSGVLAIQSK